MSQTYDVIVIGAGTAGLAALREVRKRTESFLIVNDPPYGTTCARVGCMPSKALLEAAHAFERRRAFEAFGVRGAEGLTVDVPAVLRRVRALRDDFVSGVLEVTDSLGERSVAGRARLLGPDRIEVDGRELRAKRIVIATGSRPIVPRPWRELGDRVLTSDGLFELEDLPRRIGVVGLGAIGVELAQGLAQLGSTVDAFDRGRTAAGLQDEAVASALEEALSDRVTLHFGAEVELSPAAGGVAIRGGDAEVEVDAVLAAMGRRPNVEGLGLDTLGVPLDDRGMPPVDPTTLQVADLPVYFAGDGNGERMILHEAADEGHIAGINATRDDPHCFQRRTPLGIVFCEPNVAVVGERPRDLEGKSVVVGRYDFVRQGRARTAERNRGRIAVWAACDTGRILGVELCAPAGEHLAHLLALAIERETTVQQFLGFPFYHPVIEEGLRSALRDLAKQLPAGRESDLASCPGLDAEALE